MSFTIANTSHPELIDRFKCLQRQSTHNTSKGNCIYPVNDVQIHLPSQCKDLYIKMDIRIYDYGQSLNKQTALLLNSNIFLVSTRMFTNNKVFVVGKEFVMEFTDWHTYYFAITDYKKARIYIDGNDKGEEQISSQTSYPELFNTITLFKDMEYRNIIISDKPFQPSAEVVEVPISSITGWDPSGENSYAADEEGQTCSLALSNSKLNDLKTDYDISRLVCTGVIDRQGENLNGLGVVYGKEKKNVSVAAGEHPFSIDNVFDENNIIHLIAKKV